MLSKKIAQAVSNAVKGTQGAGTRPRRGMGMIADLVAQKIVKGNAMKKGGAVKKGMHKMPDGSMMKNSDMAGRALKRKTADAKGRAMKKGK